MFPPLTLAEVEQTLRIRVAFARQEDLGWPTYAENRELCDERARAFLDEVRYGRH